MKIYKLTVKPNKSRVVPQWLVELRKIDREYSVAFINTEGKTHELEIGSAHDIDALTRVRGVVSVELA